MKRASLLLLLATACTSGLDLKEGRNYPCAPDAGDGQCLEGFICGLEGRCHAADEPGAWECGTSDRYCASSKGWFCDGVSGRCVDASSEALSPPRPLTFARISPNLPAPDHFSVSGFFDYRALTETDLFEIDEPSSVDTRSTQHWVLSANHTVTSVISLDGLDPVGYYKTPLMPWFRQDAPEPSGGVSDLAAYGVHVFVANPNGVWRRQVRVHPQAWQKLDLPNLIPTRLIDTKPNISNTPELLWALGGSSYAYINPQTGETSGVHSMPSGAQIVDLAVRQPDSTQPEIFFALTNRGLYLTQHNATGFVGATGGNVNWVPFEIPGFANLDCGSGTLPGEPLAIRVDRDYDTNLRIRVFVRENGGDPANPTVIIAHADPTPTGTIAACQNLNFTAAGTAKACPDGQKFQAASNWISYYTAANASWCTSAGGTHEMNLKFNAGAPQWSPETDEACNGPLNLPIVPTATGDNNNAWADPTGRLWFSYGDSASSTHFMRKPVHVVAGGGTVPLYAETAVEDCTDGLTNLAYYERPDAGLVEVEGLLGNFGVCGSLENAPGFVIYEAPYYDDDAGAFAYSTPPALQVTTLKDVFTPLFTEFGDYLGTNSVAPYSQLRGTEGLPSSPCGPNSTVRVNGTTFRAADGGFQALVAAGDTFFVGPLARLPDGGASPMVPRHVLSSRLNIDQVVSVLPSADAGEITAGYALAGQRVFRYTAQNPIRWSSHELEMPAGEPMALWRSDANARVGFRSGLVLSLPSRVMVGEPLSTPVDAYGSVCGVGYALSNGALYRLELQEGTTLGAWKPVAIDWGLPANIAAPSLAHGYLHSVPGMLYVFSDDGVVAKITGDCP